MMMLLLLLMMLMMMAKRIKARRTREREKKLQHSFRAEQKLFRAKLQLFYQIIVLKLSLPKEQEGN